MINELSFSKVKLLINLESCFRRFLNNMTLSYSLTLLGIEFQIIVPLCRRESLPISFLFNDYYVPGNNYYIILKPVLSTF